MTFISGEFLAHLHDFILKIHCRLASKHSHYLATVYCRNLYIFKNNFYEDNYIHENSKNQFLS